MNLSRRNEAFRYEFEEPLAGKFRLIEVDGKKIESRMGEMEVRDISPRGLKITTSLDLPVAEKKINGLFYINFAAAEYAIPGRFVWRKPRVSQYQYGIYLQCDDAMKKTLLSGLKAYVKSQQEKPSES
ncbi:PilZ domain-containing protein [Xylanibacillus composti]|uniref:PilZ domain-containing protein n=1 Tax=Xylanibacillus composti TaxID=1572762 RepID=A0A8J4H524_9BACL|nr:PilZ domain-containing protein [Xylanibacillus composti]MDT9726882.1 PilZ domain-containing protein [Xylanibacillus composti]GIQ69805.1 hypothetical protein XYCOK13_26290 [Xylanibacillus composti]